MKNLKLEKIIMFLNLLLGILQVGEIVSKLTKERKAKKQEEITAYDQI